MPTIDDYLMRIGFDNSDFEKGAKESINTLGNLKEALALRGADTGLEAITRKVSSMSFDTLTDGLNAVSNGFNAMEQIAIGVLRSIGQNIERLGAKLIDELVTKNVRVGISKYEEMTKSVQTIMSATGKSIDYVTKYTDKLNWFTDETSFNLTDMTSNISKFTSAGIALDKATTQMMGIGNASALAGSGIQAASHAMNGFSKAMAAGYMDRLKWSWIETAHMDTIEFKQALIDAAEAEGTLQRINGKLYAKSGNKREEVTAETMRETLSLKWLNKATMERALQRYGSFSDNLGDLYDMLGSGQFYTTNQLLKFIDEYHNKSLDLQKMSKLTGISVETLKDEFEKLDKAAITGTDSAGKLTYTLGRRAFAAAQEAITLSQAWDALADAVSTGWMRTFQLIFGNYTEAKELWTNLANWLYDMFAESGNVRNELLSEWHISEVGGYKDFIDSLNNIMDALTSLRDVVKDVLGDFIPDIFTVENLNSWTVKFKTFTGNIKSSIDSAKSFLNVYRNIESDTQVNGSVIPPYLQKLALRLRAKTIGEQDLTRNKFGVAGTTIDDYRELEKIKDSTTDLEYTLQMRLGNIYDALDGIRSIGRVIKDTFINAWSAIKIAFEPITKLGDKFINLFGAIGRRISKIAEDYFGTNKISEFFGSFSVNAEKNVSNIVYYVGKFVDALADLIDPEVEGGLDKFADTMKNVFSGVWDAIKETFSRAFPILSSAWNMIKSVLTGIFNTVTGFFKDLSADNIDVKFGKLFKVGIGALLVNIFKNINDSSKSISALFEQRGVFGTIWDALTGKIGGGGNDLEPGPIDRITNSFVNFTSKISNAIAKFTDVKLLKEFANSILKIAGAMFILAMIPVGDLNRASSAIAGIILAILALFAVVQKMDFTDVANVAAAGTAIAGLGTGLLTIAGALFILTLLPEDKITLALQALTWIIVDLLAFLAFLGNQPWKGMMAAAGSVLIIAPAMVLIAGALALLAFIDEKKLSKALGVFTEVMLVLAGFLSVMSLVVSSSRKGGLGEKSILAVAASLLIIAPAIMVIAGAIALLSALPSLEGGVAGLFFILLELGLFLGSLSALDSVSLIAVAAAMLILAPALVLISGAFALLTLVDLGKLAVGLTVLAVALAVIVGIGYLAKGAALGLLAIAGAFIGIGIGALGVAAAIALASVGIAAGVAIIGKTLGGVIEGLGNAFTWLKDKWNGLKSESFAQGAEIGAKYSAGLQDSTSDLEEEGDILGNILGGKFNETALTSADPSGLMDQIKEVLGDDADKLGLTGYDIGNLFGSQLENGMLSYDFSSVLDQIKAAIVNKSGATGAAAQKVGTAIGSSLTKGTKKFLKMASPSKVYMQIMDYVAAGVERGGERNLSVINDVGASIGESLYDSTSEALGLASSISPVVDLSSAQTGNLSFGATLTPSAVRNLAAVSADIQDQRSSMSDYIDSAVYSAINGMKDQLTFVVPLEVDGRQFAQSTAKFTRNELNLIDRNTLRKGGYA